MADPQTTDPGQIGRLSSLMVQELDGRYDAGMLARSQYAERRQAIEEHASRLYANRAGTPEGDPRQLALPVTQEQRDAARSSLGAAPQADEVKLTHQAGWRVSLDGAVEARTSLGTSARGHHYAVEASYQGSDPGDLAWSRPFDTQAEAQRAASVVSGRVLGDEPAVQVQTITQEQRDAARSYTVARPIDSTQAAQQRVQELRPQGHAR